MENTVENEQQEEEEEEQEGGEGEGVKATAVEQERRRPTAPLFSFPPGPRVRRTDAEEMLQVSE